MSERIGKSSSDPVGNNRLSVPSYQSSWMARWMQANTNAAGETSNFSTNELQYAGRDDSSTNKLEFPVPVRWGVIETKPSEIVSEILRVSVGNEVMHNSVVKHDRDTDDMQALDIVSGSNQDRGQVVEYKSEIQFPFLISGFPFAVGTSTRGHHYLGEGTSKNPLEPMESHSSAKDGSLAVSKPLLETFVESSTSIVPYSFDFKNCEFDKGKATLSSLIGRSTSFPDNLKLLEHSHCPGGTQSANLVLRRDSRSGMLITPSTSDHHLQQFGQEWIQKMQKCSGIRQFPSQYIASERTKSEKSHHVHSSLQKSPNCVHDVETMRICAAHSVEELPGGCPRFSQTTHSLLITQKPDVNMSKENDISTRVMTEISGNKHGDLRSLSPFFSQGNRGAELKTLSSSTDSEEKGNVGDLKASKVTSKNESSAETETMDINLFKEKNPQSGESSTATIKVIDMGSNMPPQIAAALSREVGTRNIGLPDINLELPPPAEANLSENVCRSSSRTQSLDMDLLLAHAEKHKQGFSLSPDDSMKEDPGSRWIKRLKQSSPISSAQGTKSSDLAELSHEKISKFYTRILKNRISGSQPTPRKDHDKETMHMDMSGDLPKKDKDFSADPTKNNEEVLLSHTWIQRWLHNESGIAIKKPKTVVVSEPQSSKLALDDPPKKQFPSIAAMALLGKAMNGFQECELHKKGSFTVWNTKSF